MKITKKRLKQIIVEEVIAPQDTKKFPCEPIEIDEASLYDMVRRLIKPSDQESEADSTAKDYLTQLKRTKTGRPALDTTNNIRIRYDSAAAHQHNLTKEGEDPKTMESLLDALSGLLKAWPACDHDPEGAACQYHKDLEEVVKEYGGTVCPEDSHGDEETVQEQ